MARAGLDTYTPYSRVGRALKAFFQVTSPVWATLNTGSHVHLRTAGAAQIEQLVKQRTGEPNPLFAMSIGTAGEYRKLTLQAMTPSGQVLGFLKIALTLGAEARIRAEASALHLLSTSRDLDGCVPKVIFAGDHGGQFVLFQTAGPKRASSKFFTSTHKEFLTKLGGVQPCTRVGSDIVAEVSSEWEHSDLRNIPEWRRLAERALSCARALTNGDVACGIAHGDFTPWNMRPMQSGLYVFDWESMSVRSPLVWDEFHFRAQTMSLLGCGERSHDFSAFFEDQPTPMSLGLLILYLLRSSAHLLGEQRNHRHPGITRRLAWISSLLRHVTAKGRIPERDWDVFPSQCTEKRICSSEGD